MATIAHTSTLHLVSMDGETIGDAEMFNGLWTVEQYFRLTDQSNRHFEFTDGSIEVLPIPTRRHHVISRFLLRLLLAFLEPRGGTAFYSPLRVRVREGKFREPDLIVVLDEDDPRLQDTYFLGAYLVVEIVSPDNPERDIIVKRADYAEGLIPEYWIVNPIDEIVTVLRLEREEYAEHGVFQRGDAAISYLLEELAAWVSAIFDAR
ncbi:MAG: Uma2 family endonuclease [Chloroflexota bacterium]|nr:Uma2 family endonuclease [Chloroflexota bacterium]